MICTSTYYNKIYSLINSKSNIERYSNRKWSENIGINELLYIWDEKEISNSNKLINYNDIELTNIKQMNNNNNGNGKKIYRFWDISSLIFSNVIAKNRSKSKNRKNKKKKRKKNENLRNLDRFFEYISPHCFVFLTSGIFCYQFEKIFQERYFKYEYYSSIHVSLQLFKTFFVPKIDINNNNNNNNNNRNNNSNGNYDNDEYDDDSKREILETISTPNGGNGNNNGNSNNSHNNDNLFGMMEILDADEKETREERRKLSIMNIGANILDNLRTNNLDSINENGMNDDYIDLIDDTHDIVEDCNFESFISDELINKWSSDRIPIITLFNKSDVLEKDIYLKNNSNNNNSNSSSNKENGSILMSFPNYDGNNTYDDIVAYLNTMFKSFDVDHRRPFHIYVCIVARLLLTLVFIALELHFCLFLCIFVW